MQKPSECGLPNISWIVPNAAVSEHPNALVSSGQAYVTTLINKIMESPCWGSSAIFLSWDDWGGFYDHVVPPVIDGVGYGFRVPGLVISPYAKAGYIDHQQLSHDNYLKFIENDFLEGQRLNPATDGRPDSRPDVREEAPGLGNLENDFEFNQPPRPPLILPTHPTAGPPSCPSSSPPSGASEPPSPACQPVQAPSSAPSSPSSAPVSAARLVPLQLQLVASVSARQDLRLQGGSVYLTVGCNLACSLYAHGHLSLRQHGRHPRLRNVRAKLTASEAKQISLSLPGNAEAVVRRASSLHRRVQALIDIEVRAAGQPLKTYLVRVQLAY
jgi:hypothetical protein